jgi:hypothetical protein
VKASVACALGLALTACGGGPTNPGGDGDVVTNFTAEIDAVDWSPEVEPSANNFAPGRYRITAVRTAGANPLQLVLNLYNIPGPGTYPIGVTDQVFGGEAQIIGPQYSAGRWMTLLDGAAGEITISVLTTTRMAGTFSFVAYPQQPTVATTTRTVTQGTFDLSVTGSGGVAVPNQGSRVTAIPGALSFVASETTNTMTTYAGSPLLTILAYNYPGPNTIQGLHLSLEDVTAGGTYALEAVTRPIRTITWGYTAGIQSAGWSSAGGSGSITIDTLTTARIVGTFTASMVANSGSASGPLTVSGSFSLGRGP